MRVLITGAAGFIGSNLVHHLRRTMPEADLVGFDDLSTGRPANLSGADIELIEASLVDVDAVRDAVRGADAVVHLGAVPSVPRSIADPRRSHDVNITGTFTLLEAVREYRVGHVIAASSSSVYGSNPILPKAEDAWTRPLSPYAVTKLATEAYLTAYSHSFGIATLPFRFFNVFGPRQAADHDYAAVIPRFIDAALAGRPLPLDGDGSQSRDFTYVETVCAVLAAAVRRRTASDGPVNLAFGTRTSLRELIDVIATEAGVEIEIEQRPPRIGDVHASQADSALVRRLFPEVEPVDLRVGLRTTIEWFRSTGVA